MQKTQNYNLNKPELTDPVRVGDLNENADVIDAALGELANTTPYVVGSYASTNSGDKDVVVELGFQPSMVIVEKPGDSTGNYGAVCTRDISVVAFSKTVLAVTESGFKAGLATYSGSAQPPYTNFSGPFVYIAFR